MFPLDLHEAAGVRDRGCDFGPVAHDARVGEQASLFPGAVTGDFPIVEAVEGLPVVLPLGEDGVPRESRLSALEEEEFEQLAVIVDRDPPFLVVIGDGKGVARPGAAAFKAGRALQTTAFVSWL